MTIQTKLSQAEALPNSAHFEGKTQDQSRDEFFNPWRLPTSPAARQLVAEVLDRLQTHETARQTRKRKRRAADQVIFEQSVTALVCDLVHAELAGVDGIVVTRSKRVLTCKSRYKPPVLGKQLLHILDLLADPELGLINQVLGYRSPFGPNQATVIRAGGKLRTLIIELGLTLRDLGADEQDETVVLKVPVSEGSYRKKQIDHIETAETTRMRQEMETINDRLRTADLNLVTGGVAQLGMIQARRLRRVFSHGSFTSGGRLFDGFWQPLPKAIRRTCLTINGESTVELDYGQMALRLLYGRAEVTPSWSDGYLIPLPKLAGSSDHYRDGMKILINAMLFSDKPLTRKPKETKELLPRCLSIKQLTEAVLEAHRPVAHLFHTGIGHHLQFLESELMVELLLLAGDRGITALPIHDSVIVAKSQEDETRLLMDEVFHRRTGLEPVVRVSTD